MHIKTQLDYKIYLSILCSDLSKTATIPELVTVKPKLIIIVIVTY